MPNWAVSLTWLGIYFLSLMVVPSKKLCRGLFTRHVLKRIIPPKSFWRTGSSGHAYRYWIWFIVTVILQYLVVGFGDDVWMPIFWGPIVLMLLDDYLFGDDDAWRRFWEGAKNKIKWKMDLPQPIPARVRDTGV